MKRTWTIIGVRDVAASVRWYQSLFGHPEKPPEHDDFGQILDADGTVLICLHQWGAHEHPSLRSPETAVPGNGLLLFFRVDDFAPSLKRARALVPRLDEEPHVNPSTRTREFSLRDPDGYYVTISALSAAELGAPARRRPAKAAASPAVRARVTAERGNESQLMRFPTAVARDPAIEAWMRAHRGALGGLAQRWFAVMRACGRDVRELLHDGHPTACVGDAAFAYVNVFTAHVNVGFFRGAEIADPQGLLEGSGRFMRHVKLRPGMPVDAAALEKLIANAYGDMKQRLRRPRRG